MKMQQRKQLRSHTLVDKKIPSSLVKYVIAQDT